MAHEHVQSKSSDPEALPAMPPSFAASRALVLHASAKECLNQWMTSLLWMSDGAEKPSQRHNSRIPNNFKRS